MSPGSNSLKASHVCKSSSLFRSVSTSRILSYEDLLSKNCHFVDPLEVALCFFGFPVPVFEKYMIKMLEVSRTVPEICLLLLVSSLPCPYMLYLAQKYPAAGTFSGHQHEALNPVLRAQHPPG